MKKFFLIATCFAMFFAACEQLGDGNGASGNSNAPSPIGDIGPGGGIIFFAQGGQFMEVSGELGSHTLNGAEVVARNHRGGGFTDWRLPNSGHFTLLRENLHQKGLGDFFNDRYWGTGNYTNPTMGMSFNFQNASFNFSTAPSHALRVRAVRSFAAPSEPPPTTTTLTIRNESSHEINNVLWNNVSFTTGAGSIHPGQSVTMSVQAGSGFVRFQPRLNPRNLRSDQLVVVEGEDRMEFVIINSTIVVDENNVRDTLDVAVARRTTLTIRNESSHEITHVHWNNVSFSTGTNPISPGMSVTRDVQAGIGFIRMRPRLNPFNLRSYQLVAVAADERKEFVILNNTMIVKEIDNTGGTLASVASVQLQIGNTGPGGGTIFFASGGQFREVSGELGLNNAANAMNAARGHRGGGFEDWRIPDSGDLTLMYENLHQEGLGGFSDDNYWGGCFINLLVFVFDFSTGRLFQANNYGVIVIGGVWFRTTDNMRTRAVRSFSVQ